MALFNISGVEHSGSATTVAFCAWSIYFLKQTATSSARLPRVFQLTAHLTAYTVKLSCLKAINTTIIKMFRHSINKHNNNNFLETSTGTNIGSEERY
jgi:hypothetical protein